MKWDTEDPPSIAAYMQGLQPRPLVHIIWEMPEGVELWDALMNLRRGRCWCGNKHRQTNRYGCTTEHSRIFSKSAEYWLDVRDRVLARARGMCAICKKNVSHDADHIVSIKAGGDPWAPDNLRALCHPCHSKKNKQDAMDRKVYRLSHSVRTLDKFMRDNNGEVAPPPATA